MDKSLSDIIDQNVNTLSHLFHNSATVINRIDICGSCKGEGYIQVTTNKGHVIGLEVEDHKCNNCNGSGRIDIEITIRMKPHKPKQHETARS